MLSTELSTIWPGVALAVNLILVLWVVIRTFHTENLVEDAVLWLRDNNAKSVSMKKMADVQCSLSELTDSYTALLDSHKKLRSRIGMRAVRETEAVATAQTDVLPDSRVDPDGYKRIMRRRMQKGILT